MVHQNVEFKARCEDPNRIRSILKEKEAVEKGTDYQTDTYFQIHDGRLKLREGTIENNLIYYERPDQAGPKQADIHLYETEPDTDLKPLLTAALDVLVVVKKKREIYFINNVKFHIDVVEGLGSFVEVEAIDRDGTIGRERLHEQCQSYLDQFEISDSQLVSQSYSDLLLEQEEKSGSGSGGAC